ncbi:MAG TPA: lamin tail domain-containing protein, partial [Chthoniobacteraceae bacterium]|nr:lamin tail domain-containing protein [Chthoniobacteraceae bacterium]
MRGTPIVLALIFAAFCARAADSVLVFNEVQYHPPAGQSEWIELRSLQGVDVNIGGWRIEGGVDYTFPAGTVMPGGGYIVIAESPAQISGALGPWTGQLDNGGDTIRLVNFNGRIMDELTYGDSGDWPVAPDGSGTTLARRAASAAEGPEAWTNSNEIGGTPGGLNFYDGAAAMRTVVVAIGATWKYEDSGAVPPADWKTAGFNDSGWKSGATLITGGGAKLGGGARPSAIPDGLIGYWA